MHTNAASVLYQSLSSLLLTCAAMEAGKRLRDSAGGGDDDMGGRRLGDGLIKGEGKC